MDEINNVRAKIDDIDTKIMKLLDKRFEFTNRIGELKKQTNKVVLDINREEYILDKISKYSHSPQIEVIYNTIMNESKNAQRK